MLRAIWVLNKQVLLLCCRNEGVPPLRIRTRLECNQPDQYDIYKVNDRELWCNMCCLPLPSSALLQRPETLTSQGEQRLREQYSECYSATSIVNWRSDYLNIQLHLLLSRMKLKKCQAIESRVQA